MNSKSIKNVIISTCLLLMTETGFARYAAIVVDANSGNILQQVDANQAWYPASLTKVMTLYMAFSALKNGRLNMDDLITVSSHAAAQKPSKLGLRPWQQISVEEAILAVITRSANDAAVALAEKIGGSESRFASQMTEQAHDINMSNSQFMNATGLPHDMQVTTAHDMALLAWRIQRDFPQYYRLFSAPGFYFNGREYHSTNKFVASYPGAEGMKTGYTCGAGYNLIATAQQNGRRLIGVVLGGLSSAERYDMMYELMDDNFYGLPRYNRHGSSHINTLQTSYAGTPPYQLGCGNRPTTHYAYKPHYKENIEVAEDDGHSGRWVPKTKVITVAKAMPAPVQITQKTVLPVNTQPSTAVNAAWAVDLGSFSDEASAEDFNFKANIHLVNTLSPGRPIVVKRMVNKQERWHAMWSGYRNIFAAGDICKVLWQRNIQCTVSRPDMLTTPGTTAEIGDSFNQ